MTPGIKKTIGYGIIFIFVLYIPTIVVAWIHPWSYWDVIWFAPGFSCLFLFVMSVELPFEVGRGVWASLCLTIIILGSLAIMAASGKQWLVLACLLGIAISILSAYTFSIIPNMGMV